MTTSLDSQEVTLDDQNNINAFSKLNWQLTKLEEKLQEKKEELSYLVESMNEIELCFDEERIFCRIGDTFASMKPDKVTRHISTLHSLLSDQIRGIEEQCNAIKGESSRLKVLLYGKFKDSIHLEME